MNCVIDGRPVPLTDWQAQVDADWGDRNLTGNLPRSVPWATQGAPIQLWTPWGSLLWSGELTQDPRPDGDVFAIQALGPAEVLAANEERMMYRIDGAAEWVEQDAEPHEFTYEQQFDLIQKQSKMEIRMGNGGSGTMNIGEGAGFVIWTEGAEITRYTVVVDPLVAYTAFDFFTKRFTGPTGTRTDITSHTLNTASPTLRGASITTAAEDALYFRVEATASAASSTRRRVKFTQIKVYGRTRTDTFSVSDVVSDVAALSGLEVDKVQSHDLAALPLDWIDDHPSLLNYMAELVDWHWEARGDGMHFGPWSKIWTAFTNRDASAQLEPEPRYNRFPVRYEAMSGAHREVVGVPEVDPFPDREFFAPGVDIEDPQADSTLPEAVAQAGADHVAARNLNGPIELARVRDDRGGVHSPHAVTAGECLLMPDLHPVGVQRIRSITYRPDGATVQVGETFSPIHVISGFRREKKRRKRRRPRRRAA